MKHVTKYFPASLKSVTRDKREIEFIARRMEVDRDGEVVVTRGIDTTAFMKNPVLLLEHDHRTRFGRVDSLRVERRDGADALVGRATILPAGVSAAADQGYGELLYGALNGISIGVLVHEWDPSPILPGQRGRTMTQTQLLEISAVPIPSCSSCVVTAKSAATWKANDIALEIAPALDDVVLEIEDTFDIEELNHVLPGLIGDAIAQLVCRTVREEVLYASGRVD